MSEHPREAPLSRVSMLSPTALVGSDAIILDGGLSESELRTVLDALPAAIYTTDAAGRVTYYNRAAAELAGREPELGKDEWCVTWRLYNRDGTPLPHDQCPMAIAIKENRAVRGAEAILEPPDGTRLHFVRTRRRCGTPRANWSVR